MADTKTATQILRKVIGASTGVDIPRLPKRQPIPKDDDGLSQTTVNLWEKDTSWSDEAETIKKRVMRQVMHGAKPTISMKELYALLKTLKLCGKAISITDPELSHFTNLRYLSLNGNLIENVQHLPPNLELQKVPEISHLKHLVHLGLSHNRIQSLDDMQQMPQLQSLDLASNDLSDMSALSKIGECCKALRILSLSGNPISFIKNYRYMTLAHVPGVQNLDETQVMTQERRAGPLTPQVHITLAISNVQLKNLQEIKSEQEGDQPPDDYVYFVEWQLQGYPDQTIATEQKPFDSLIPLEITQQLIFAPEARLRDGGLQVWIKYNRLEYIPKPEDSKEDDKKKKKPDSQQKKGKGKKDLSNWIPRVAETVVLVEQQQSLSSIMNNNWS
ncbi:hypothetical protein EDD86DRAFT_246441 [Gorgonomyces haynaldii]|nr:hypothetical protein EDD86DRAFT_246441 [Gorgonomyces haynaldii]